MIKSPYKSYLCNMVTNMKAELIEKSKPIVEKTQEVAVKVVEAGKKGAGKALEVGEKGAKASAEFIKKEAPIVKDKVVKIANDPKVKAAVSAGVTVVSKDVLDKAAKLAKNPTVQKGIKEVIKHL